MRFTPSSGFSPLDGRLVYRDSECSFDFIPQSSVALKQRSGPDGTTSVLLQTLQIELDVETGSLLYPWGYLPSVSWRTVDLDMSVTVTRSLIVKDDEGFVAGVSVSVDRETDWIPCFDRGTGWFCMRQTGPTRNSEFFEFATSSVAELHEGRLVALWLHPEFEIELPRSRIGR